MNNFQNQKKQAKYSLSYILAGFFSLGIALILFFYDQANPYSDKLVEREEEYEEIYITTGRKGREIINFKLVSGKSLTLGWYGGYSTDEIIATLPESGYAVFLVRADDRRTVIGIEAEEVDFYIDPQGKIAVEKGFRFWIPIAFAILGIFSLAKGFFFPPE